MIDTPYLIKADSRNTAETLAEELDLTDDDWLFLPSTLEDEENAIYISRRTEPVTFETSRSLSDDEKSKLWLNDQWKVRILLAANFWEAAAYAAERSWWLHSWVWIEVPVLSQVKEYQLLTD